MNRRIWLFVLAVLMLCSSGESQTTGTKKTAQKKHRKATTATIVTRADSLARVDSLRRVESARALADSLQRAEEAVRERRRADSLALFTLRSVENGAFGTGERLVFDVNYGFITAGEAIMAVAGIDTIRGRPSFRVEFRVNSLPSFSWIYKVEDLYYTFIDVAAIVPWRFEQHIREGGYRRDFVASFDQFRHRATTTEGEYEIPPYVHDILSAFYFARTVDYSQSKPGDLYTLFNFYKDQSHELGVKFLGRQELEVGAGTFNTIVLEPLVKEGGLFKSDGRIVIWLSDDEVKIPVRVNTKVVIGSIDTELREYSGLRVASRARVK